MQAVRAWKNNFILLWALSIVNFMLAPGAERDQQRSLRRGDGPERRCRAQCNGHRDGREHEGDPHRRDGSPTAIFSFLRSTQAHIRLLVEARGFALFEIGTHRCRCRSNYRTQLLASGSIK